MPSEVIQHNNTTNFLSTSFHINDEQRPNTNSSTRTLFAVQWMKQVVYVCLAVHPFHLKGFATQRCKQLETMRKRKVTKKKKESWNWVRGKNGRRLKMNSSLGFSFYSWQILFKKSCNYIHTYLFKCKLFKKPVWYILEGYNILWKLLL